METPSPYLQGIQAIPGTVPGQKYKELNLIAERIVARIQSLGDSGDAGLGEIHDEAVTAELFDYVPEALRPLVQVEISNILRDYGGVIEALKSDDSVVANRAMKISWFFRGTNKDVISVKYFEKNILPFVSLNTRILLMKKLATNLRSSRETKLGEEFYTYFARQYGRKQAETLLLACSENFIYDTVTTNKITLSCRMVRILFVTNPNLVIRYLKSFKPIEHAYNTNNGNATIYKYNKFLPRLIKKHSGAFTELLDRHNCPFGISLSNKAAETFLKSSVEALLDKPKLYTKIMPLKIIAAKLTRPQYKLVFRKMFPARWQEFCYPVVRNFLEYYPEQERMALVIDSYREAYNRNFLDNSSVIDEHFLLMLPQEERVRQARIKLQSQSEWDRNPSNLAMAWGCYLPISESIPAIKDEISKSPNATDRTCLLKQMFYSCKVNNDKEALLGALSYFTTRHKNEMIPVISEVLHDFAARIDLSSLSEDHWKILDDFIQFLRIKGELKITQEILIAGVHFNLIHDLPIDEKIELLLEIYLRLNTWNAKWSILPKYPEYNRRCIDAFMTMIPQKYPETDEIWKNHRSEIIDKIVESIYNFNTRNTKANCKIERLSIKNYPWLLEMVKNLVQDPPKDETWVQASLISILKIHEKDLYKDWVVIESPVVVPVNSRDAFRRLKKDPKDILDNWEEYLKDAISNARLACVQRFIRKTRWHQEIPIKFVERCLRDFDSGSGSSSAILILGILMEGNEYAKVIEPLLPQDSKIDIKNENASSSWDILSKVTKGMNLTNPPVPLRLILQLCEGDYLSLGLASLTNACRRTSIKKIEPFIKALVDRRVSVKKHGIRLFCLLASMNELRPFLTELWRTEKHRSIRAVIFEKIYSLFITKPTPDTWEIMKNCMADFTVNDNMNFPELVKLREIPVQYIADYIKELLKTLEKLEANGFGKKITKDLVKFVLQGIDESICKRLPEGFCQELMFKYFFKPSIYFDLNLAGMKFVLNGYIPCAGEKLEARLEVLCKHYEDMLKERWNVPHPDIPSFFPVNYIAHRFMMSLIELDDKIVRSRTMELVLKSFLNVLRPECDFLAYCLMTYGIALKEAQTSREVVDIICETFPKLVDVFSTEIVTHLADISKTWIQILAESQVQQVMYDLIENLCAIGTYHACLMAAKILFLTNNLQFEERYCSIVKFLREVKYPGIVSLVYLHANTRILLHYDQC